MSQKRYDQLRKAVAKRVQSLMDEKEWTLSHFALELGKSKSHVSSVLKGTANLTLRVISEMEITLGDKILEIESKKPIL